MRKLTMNKQRKITFQEGCENYIQYCKARNLRDGTIKHYRESIHVIYKFIDPATLIETFNQQTIDTFVIDVKHYSKIKDTTLYTYTRDLKTLMRFFMKNDYMKVCDLKLIKASKEPIECYTDDELKLLLKKPNIRKCSFTEYKSWVIINFLLSTGIRLNSLINIQIKDVDFYSNVVYVRVTKNRKSLILPLNQTIMTILKEYINHRQYKNTDEYLFCNVFGNQLNKNTLYQNLYEYNKRRGVNKTGIHRYRHTFAKKWIINGGNVVVLQKILGHSSLDITQNYINLLTNDLKKEIESYDILREFNSTTIKLIKNQKVIFNN